MKKRIIIALIIGSVISLCGCGNKIPELTQEQTSLVATYASDLLVQYSPEHDTRLIDTDKEAKRREEIAEKAAKVQEIIDAQKEAETKFVAVSGGILIQDTDRAQTSAEECKLVTEKGVTEEEMNDLIFGFKVVKHVKSNAIVIVKDGQTLGIGAGQMNRVGAAKIALEQAGEKAKGAVLASDAFFPMDDTVRLAAEFGIASIIQPGGSIKDADSIAACNELGMSMVFTGKRHFKH